ncbi:MAG: hypothetical protein AAGL89_15575 [Pseudomonadota bacterium]
MKTKLELEALIEKARSAKSRGIVLESDDTSSTNSWGPMMRK